MTHQQEIAATLKAWFLENDGPWSLADDQGSHLALDGTFDPAEIVRVVLSAAREPTKAMLTAPSVVATDFGDIWRAMIDEILNT